MATATATSPLATVQGIYESFGTGDIPAIIAKLAPDVAWEQWDVDNFAQKAGVPWLQEMRGPEGALAFFQVIGQWNFHSFEVKSLMEGPNQVAVEFWVDVTIQPGNQRIQEEEIHLWTFNDAGQVVRFRHYSDTAKHIAAAGK